uniref:1-phosphatidylinositol 4-kinase n=2 Tax=Anthurium amnicola TaxID=1678845 RepID=A0A1D1Z1U7_9ARAE
MVRILGLRRLVSDVSPREITKTPISAAGGGGEGGAGVGETGWLVRFFDSSFFCEWIAVSYLYKHDHPGVRDYLCNRMYKLTLAGIESYLFQICYMLIHKPSPSLDKFVIDMCSKSLRIALKVHWFLMAELEDTEDNEGISRIQENCQIAATLMGEWPTLLRNPSSGVDPPASPSSSKSHPVLNRLLSSKQKLLSLASSPSSASSPSQEDSNNNSSISNNSNINGKSPSPSEENSLLKKLIPRPKVRDALFFRKSFEKEEEDSDKDGFLRRLLRDSKDKDEDDSDKESFFKRLLRDSKDEDEEMTSSSDGFFKRLFRDKGEKSGEEEEKEGFFKRLFKDKHEEKAEEDEKGNGNIDEGESSDFLSFRRLFRVHPEEPKASSLNENGGTAGPFECSPGTENFFRKLFRDWDRAVEDSELLGSKKSREKYPVSPKQRNGKAHAKPPLPNNLTIQIRKGTYHASLEFIQSLCDTSYGLVEIFPIEDRKRVLCESLMEINSTLASAQTNGGIFFPMGKGMYRVIHIPVDEAVLLNSRDKAPFLICVEVLKGEAPSHAKEAFDAHKLSKGGIPLANRDAQLPKPPPWAYPLWNQCGMHHHGTEKMLRSTSDAIDHAMTHLWEAKIKFVRVSVSAEKKSTDCLKNHVKTDAGLGIQSANLHSASISTEFSAYEELNGWDPAKIPKVDHDLDWVSVNLSAVPGVNMEDIEDQEPPHRKEHRRVPSTVAIEEVKAAAAKGQAPPGLALKGAGQDLSDSQLKVANGGSPKAIDALAGELWDVKKERIRTCSTYGKSPGWDLRSVIVKSGDDCRQEHLAVQLVSHFYDIFQEAGLPLWLRPYEVLVTSSYTALIETIPDTASLHSIKSRFPKITSLRDFFIDKYGDNSPSFKLAQRNFVESMAGYSILCYLLQVKDRHNGNLLLDEEGHIIHIDFGFMLSNSPGGVNFESAPFKLTRELLEVMDSDAEGNPSEFFDCFKVLCIQGFLTCRKHAERIILLVEMFQDSGFPCFKGGPRTIQNLRKRFHLGLTEEQCVSLVLSLISSSLDAWRTRQYDYYQRVLNGIL